MSDWAQVDTSASDGTLPSAIHPPDLFGGDLFGDELIDMYNSDVVVGATGGKGEKKSQQIGGVGLT